MSASSTTPALFIASNAMPARHRAVADHGDRTCGSRPSACAATAMPSAAEIDVDECAVPKVSYSLSSRRGKPEMPPSWRSVFIWLAPAGQDLVRIGLVADVPDDAVVRRVEDVVQRDRQLDRAEVRRQVAAGLRRRVSSTNARSSSASCVAARARDSRRRSAGSSIVFEQRGHVVIGPRSGVALRRSRSASSRSCSRGGMPLPSRRSAACAASRSSSARARAASRPSTVT